MRKTKIIQVRCSTAFYDELKRHCESIGLSMSSFGLWAISQEISKKPLSAKK